MRTSEEIRQEAVKRLGHFPPCLATAIESPVIMENLWQQMLAAYLDNPLSPLFKEKLLACLARYHATPYYLVVHICNLHRLGMPAALILQFLRQPLPKIKPLLLNESESEEALLACAIYLARKADPDRSCQQTLRKILGPARYDHLIALLGFSKTCQLWTKTHPEIDYRQNQMVQAHLETLFRQEPLFTNWLGNNIWRAKSSGKKREEKLLAEIARQDRVRTALRESEKRFKQTVMHAPLPIMVYAEDGQVVLVNHAWTELSGYTQEDIPTVGVWMQHGQPGEKESVKTDMAALDGWHEIIDEGEYPISTRQGQTRRWEFSSASLGRLPDGRRAVIRMAVDLTERKRLEEALWQTNHKVINILEAITDGFIALDPLWRFVYLNRKAERLIKVNREDLIGRCVWDLFPHLRNTPLAAQAQRAVKENQALHTEAFYPPLDMWLETHLYPSPEGLSIYYRDITDRKRTQEDREESQHAFRLLVQASPLAMIGVDLEGLVTMWNPAAEKLFGWSKAYALGRFNPAIPQSQREIFLNDLQSLTSEAPKTGLKRSAIRRDGTIMPVNFSIAPIHDANENIRGFMGIIQEIKPSDSLVWPSSAGGH